MQEKDWGGYSWTVGLLITGLCFLAFSGAMWFLDGRHLPLFTYGGSLLIIASVIHGIVMKMTDPDPTNEEQDPS
jgi:cell division protein FtsW (lipid II flippase)